MKAALLRIPLPLLVKDLTEQAARRRTYVIRVVYAALLLVIGGVYLSDIMRRSRGNFMNILGGGQELFEFVVYLQFFGIYLFGPAVMVGCITQEKERQTFPLLLLTELRPWEIVLQKLLSRLIPMLMFVMLSMPLMALAYGFGGVSTSSLVVSGVLLLLAAVQMACLCVMMSAWCRSTTGAFIGAYLVGTTIALGPMLLNGIASLTIMLTTGKRWSMGDDFLFALCPPYLFHVMTWRPMSGLAWLTLPIVISSLVFLVLARVFLVRRALLPPRDVMVMIFRSLDRFWQRVNWVSGGVVLLRDRESLPENRPVAWREVTKKALGKPHYLFRVLVLTTAPVFIILVCLLALDDGWNRNSQAELLTVMLMFLWPLALILIAVMGASTFATERSRQTMDVLLATPMTGPQIVKEKVAALRRMMLVLAVPFVLLCVVEAWWEYGTSGHWYADHPTWAYLAGSALALLIYMPMMGWLSVWIGLRSKRPALAVVTALAVMGIWILLPWCFLPLADMYWGSSGEAWGITLGMIGPSMMVAVQEFGIYRAISSSPWLVVAVNFTCYGLLLLLFRHLCLSGADRYLGRA